MTKIKSEKQAEKISLNISRKMFNPIYLRYYVGDQFQKNGAPRKGNLYKEGVVVKPENEGYHNLLTDYKTRTLVFYGGGGSGKSKFAVQRMVYKCLKMNNRKVLVVRNVLATIRDSVFAEFKDCLNEWGLIDYCEIKETYLVIKFPNGSEIIFKGLDDEERIKSIQGITDIFVEEATEIDKEKYDQLQIRMRNKRAGYNQIVLCYNPISKMNWVYNTFHRNGPPKNCIVVHTNYKHNKFLPQDNVDILEEMAISNPYKYQVYALGHFASLGKLIYTNYSVQDFDETELRMNKVKAYYGMDFGFTADPSTFVKVYCDKENKKLYIADEMYKTGMLNTDIYRWVYGRGYDRETITADSSEPKSIEELRRKGLSKIKGARKGNDSVIHGIQYIQNFEIVVKPSCKNFIMELENYTYKKDKVTDEYTNKPADEYNHLMDALRYAVEETMARNRMRSMSKAALGF